MNSCTLFQQTSPRKRWSFAFDLYRPEEDSWPVQVLRGCCHPQTGTPYLLFQDGQLRPVPQNAADSLGLSK